MAAHSVDHEYYAYLASCIRKGDNDAFAELYDATYESLRRYCMYFLKDPDLIQDAMQEIYISVFKGISSLKMDILLYSWLKQIAYHTCCSVLRRMRQTPELSTEDESQLAFLAGVEDSEDCFQPVYDRDIARQLREALDTLPQQPRQAFLLRYENELKLEQIADFMDTSVSSVKRYIASARESLQEKLSGIRTGTGEEKEPVHE